MKFISIVLFLNLVQLTANACDDISGTYQSEDPKLQRTYLIEQNNCSFVLKLNNHGALPDPQYVRADNIAYDRSSKNYTDDGHVINPFLPADKNSHRVLRAYSSQNTLVVNSLFASFGKSISDCKEQLGIQDNCSFLQIVLSKDANGNLLETQNGYRYFSGNHEPIYIQYKKIK